MAQTEITKDEINAVYPTVAETIADALGCDIEEVKPDASLIEAEFEQKGLVTDVGLAQLKAYLSEVPAARFRTPMKVKEIPRLFTPETFCKLVIAAQRQGATAT